MKTIGKMDTWVEEFRRPKRRQDAKKKWIRHSTNWWREVENQSESWWRSKKKNGLVVAFIFLAGNDLKLKFKMNFLNRKLNLGSSWILKLATTWRCICIFGTFLCNDLKEHFMLDFLKKDIINYLMLILVGN